MAAHQFLSDVTRIQAFTTAYRSSICDRMGIDASFDRSVLVSIVCIALLQTLRNTICSSPRIKIHHELRVSLGHDFDVLIHPEGKVELASVLRIAMLYISDLGVNSDLNMGSCGYTCFGLTAPLYQRRVCVHDSGRTIQT